ncbi:MAG: ABC transporter permease, partial [Elusimicrobia bacterium]|nr:ABC transporter permease [Elusimicrobiota bacterium]
MNFNFTRARSIAKKEFKHILRDPFTLAMALGMPVILLTFFGFIIDFNYKNISLVFFDKDNSRFSREFRETFSSSGYFNIMRAEPRMSDNKYLDSGEASGVITIKENFGKNISQGKTGEALLLLDGADNTKAGTALSYVYGIAEFYNRKFSPQSIGPLELKTRFLFNPELNSRWFIVPGLSVVIIGLLSILLTALTIAREWETGSMELLLSTPVRPLEIILGKITP